MSAFIRIVRVNTKRSRLVQDKIVGQPFSVREFKVIFFLLLLCFAHLCLFETDFNSLFGFNVLVCFYSLFVHVFFMLSKHRRLMFPVIKVLKTHTL